VVIKKFNYDCLPIEGIHIKDRAGAGYSIVITDQH